MHSPPVAAASVEFASHAPDTWAVAAGADGEPHAHEATRAALTKPIRLINLLATGVARMFLRRPDPSARGAAPLCCRATRPRCPGRRGRRPVPESHPRRAPRPAAFVPACP